MVKVEQTEQLQAYLTLYYPLSSPTQSLMACKLLGNAVPFTMQFVAAKAVGKQVIQCWKHAFAAVEFGIHYLIVSN